MRLKKTRKTTQRSLLQRVTNEINEANQAKEALTLDLSSHGIGDESAEELASAIRQAEIPLTILLRHNNIGAIGIAHLATAIEEAQFPLILDLRNNNIGFSGIESLVNPIKKAPTTFGLHLTLEDMGHDEKLSALRLLAGALDGVQFPRILDLGGEGSINNIGNNIRAEGAEILAHAIKTVRAPLTLNLSWNKLKDDGTVHIADAMEDAEFPLVLHLGNNGIGDRGAKALSNAIKEVKNALTLSIAYNLIGLYGLKFLASAVQAVKHPLTLDLSCNSIENAGAEELAKAIMEKEVKASLALGLGYDLLLEGDIEPIGMAGIESLANVAKTAQFPLTLDLNNNGIGDEGAGLLAGALEEAQFPLDFNMSYNDISDEGAERLANAIKQTGARVLLALDLSFNIIGREGAKSIADAMTQAKVPLKLIWHDNKQMRNAGEKLLNNAESDNFMLDAGTNPENFFKRTQFKLSGTVLQQILGRELPKKENCEAGIATLIQGYVGIDDMASTEAVAIRSVEGASKENKYDSISIGNVLLYLISRTSTILPEGLPVPEGYVDVATDGLCFYYAIERQLRDLYGIHHEALALQQMAINEIVEHLDIYTPFIVHRGGLEGFLHYHLQRQDSDEGGWADNIMIQALANVLGYRVDVQVFDRAGHAIGAALEIGNHDAPVLRIGNIDNLHFVAANNIHGPIQACGDGGVAANSPGQLDDAVKMEDKEDGGSGGNLEEEAERVAIARFLAEAEVNKDIQELGKDSDARKAAEPVFGGDMEDWSAGDEGDNIEEGDEVEEEIDWDQYRCQDGSSTNAAPTPAPTVISENSSTSNATLQAYYWTLECGDASSFELGTALSGMDSTIINI
jgi:Ran GTPase-activating protein (RanGAP) involved in mRNA processing and transport